MALKRRPPSVEAIETVAYQALSSGGTMPSGWIEADGSFTPNIRHVHWDVSGSCRNPVRVTLHSKESRSIGKAVTPMTVTLETECRKCEVCLRKRAARWRYRAVTECKQAERTWFATLTFRPEEHYRHELLARAGPRPGDHEEHALEAWRQAQVKEAGKELTKFLKRVRKNSGQPLRYLAVAEMHRSARTSAALRDRPHFHLLIHEKSGCPITWKCLTDAWTVGHSKFKLIEGVQGAMYVCKYISKEGGARIRASFNYGNALEHSEACLPDLLPAHLIRVYRAES